MKKYTVTLFALALAIGSLGTVGCGGDPPPDPNAGNTGESSAPSGDGLTEKEKEMQKKNPDFTSGRGSDTNEAPTEPKK